MPILKSHSHLAVQAPYLAGLLLVAFLISSPALAQIPEMIGYQGLLTGTDGMPLPDGSYDVAFSLYEDAAGGTALWAESKSVGVTNGVMSTLLGQVESLSDVPFDRPYWLGISIDSGSELTPRVALASSPYALGSRTSGSSGDAFTLPF